MPDNIDNTNQRNGQGDEPHGEEEYARERARRAGERPDPANEYEDYDWREKGDEPSGYRDRPERPVVRRDRYDDEEVEEEAGEEMGFFDHLEELRWRIVKSLIAVAVTSGICGYFYNDLIEKVLFRPAHQAHLKIINTEMAGQFTLAIQVVLVSGLILAIPIVIWQVWGFIKPGLYPNERKYVSAIAAATIFCFLLGVVFAYFVMIPNSIGFLAGFKFEGVENTITIANFFSFVLGFILAAGAVFEMPMLSYALSRFGIVTPAFMRHYRRHAVVVIVIIAAIVTPTPDPFNCLMLALPLYALYEISIFVSGMAKRQRSEAMAEITDGSEAQ
jgi:sec-independent protein translocase protein TatC